MSANDGKGTAICRTPDGDQLREALRAALGRFIDPDDDAMPALNRVDGGFTWVLAETVIDDLVAAVGTDGNVPAGIYRLHARHHRKLTEALGAEPGTDWQGLIERAARYAQACRAAEDGGTP